MGWSDATGPARAPLDAGPCELCGRQSEVSSDTATIFVHGGSVLPRGGEVALVEGTLTNRDGCVLLEQEDAGIAYPVIWPSGTSIASEHPLALKLPTGEELAIGEAVSGAGSFPYSSSEDVNVQIPAECVPETDEVAVFNQDAEPMIIGR